MLDKSCRSISQRKQASQAEEEEEKVWRGKWIRGGVNVESTNCARGGWILSTWPITAEAVVVRATGICTLQYKLKDIWQ